MIRVNHKGVHMDNDGDQWNVPGNVAEVVAHVHQARAAGMGVISMKLIGEGAFTQRSDRQQAMRFAFGNCGRGLRHRRLQEHSGDRRSHRQPEPGARVAAQRSRKTHISVGCIFGSGSV